MEIDLDFEKLVKELDQEEREELFASIDEETSEIREYLKKFDSESLNVLAMLLIDPNMDGSFNVSDKYKNMDMVEFIINYYKCSKIDYTYENVAELIDDIKGIVEEHFEAFGLKIPEDL